MASLPPEVRVGVGAFVLASTSESTTNPRFLIGRRIGSHGAGSYALPGGHLEFGEELEQCAARELKEETGLDVTNVRFLTATNDFMPADNKHYITLFMVCERSDEKDEAQTLEPDKCLGWEWASWEDLVSWVDEELRAQDGEVLERTVFKPLLNLVRQRPGTIPSNVK